METKMTRPAARPSIRRTRRLRSPLVAVAGLSATVAVVSTARAEDVRFELGAAGSTATSTFQFSIPIEGTLIGDYDPKTNPGGTQTRPGLFGGSGNNPIDCTVTVSVANDGGTTVPTGEAAFDLSGLEASTMTVESLSLDLLAGGTGVVSGEIILLYETFRSFDPFSIYPGGFEIPVPIAGAEVGRSEFALVEPFTIEVGIGKGGAVAFDALLPVIWTVEFDPGTGPQLQEIPSLLPFVGTVTGAPGARRVQFGGAASNSGSEPLDIPIPPIPLPLPTIPPGNTANLLLEGSVTGVDFATGLDVFVLGEEIVSSLPGDLNGDGRIDSADIGLLIASWGPCVDCPADLNGDGLVDSSDLGLVIAGWSI